MFALIVNFIFSRFQAFVGVAVSGFVIQAKNRKKFQLSFFGISNIYSCLLLSLFLAINHLTSMFVLLSENRLR